MTAYKLFRVTKSGVLRSLFIDRRQDRPLGQWLPAASHPTKGFAIRPGWHAAYSPVAPHLGTKGRAWYRVELRDVTEHIRPECQGGKWLLARWMKIVAPVSATQLQQTTP